MKNNNFLVEYNNIADKEGFLYDKSQRSIVEDLFPQFEMDLTGGIFRKVFLKSKKKGIYMHGSPGTGKSMLMKLFFDNITIKTKKYLHFSTFMRSTHEIMHELKKKKVSEPITELVKKLEIKKGLLCIDELYISDITDAMLFQGIYEYLLKTDAFFFITSNREPDDLYKDGLKRDLFMPTIELLKQKLSLISLDSDSDYRKQEIKDKNSRFFFGKGGYKNLNNAFKNLIDQNNTTEITLTFKKRNLVVKTSYKKIAFFTFDELFVDNLSYVDYQTLMQHFDTIFISDIPQLSPQEYNEAIRFISFIDIVYENNIALFCSFSVSITQIYKSGKNHFEFQRTISRLHELMSKNY